MVPLKEPLVRTILAENVNGALGTLNETRPNLDLQSYMSSKQTRVTQES